MSEKPCHCGPYSNKSVSVSVSVSPPSPGRGGGCNPLDVSKRIVVELRGTTKQIALAEYSRLVALFLVLGQYLTPLWQLYQIYRYIKFSEIL